MLSWSRLCKNDDDLVMVISQAWLGCLFTPDGVVVTGRRSLAASHALYKQKLQNGAYVTALVDLG